MASEQVNVVDSQNVQECPIESQLPPASPQGEQFVMSPVASDCEVVDPPVQYDDIVEVPNESTPGLAYPDPDTEVVHHQHQHFHKHVRKTVLKDCGNHFHINRSRRVYITEVHHHHHITIKHVHVYDSSGNLDSSSTTASLGEASSSEPGSSSSDDSQISQCTQSESTM